MDQVIKSMVSNSHFEYSLKNNLSKVLSEKSPISKDEQKSSKSIKKCSIDKLISTSNSKKIVKKSIKSNKKKYSDLFEKKMSNNQLKEQSKYSRSTSPKKCLDR